MGLFNFPGLSAQRINDIVQLASASYVGGVPPSGWRALTGNEVGFRAGTNTGTYEGSTFVGPTGFFGAPAARAYRKGNSLAISFRGTDSIGDYATYLDILGNNNYINAFNEFLAAVARYARSQGISDISVTGHSLGAAAANKLRNVSRNRFGGFFNNSAYLSIATPSVSSSQNILNIGYENDWVFKSIARQNRFIGSDFISTTDNIIYYDDKYASPGGPGLFFDPVFNTSVHGANFYVDGVSRILGSEFYSSMNQDSNVIVVATDKEVTDKLTITSDHFGESVFYVGRDVKDKIKGNDDIDYFDALGGNDELNGGGGNDIFIGGSGNDTIDGGDGENDTARFSGSVNEYDFSISEDGETVTVNHARGSRADGQDTLTSVEFGLFGDRRVQLLGNTLKFVEDFVVGSTQDPQVVFNLIREGDTSFPLSVFLDGRVTRGNTSYTPGTVTLGVGSNPSISVPADLSDVETDVRYSLELSVSESQENPLSGLVVIEDGDISGVFIGDQVDDRGGKVFSDPHFITFDNLSYDFQASGDFILARSTSGPAYVVHARFVPLSSAVSITKAMGTLVGRSSVSIENVNGVGQLLVNGQIVTLASGDSVPVGPGSVSRSGRTITINHGNGDRTSVEVFNTFLNVTPSPSLNRARGSIQGLLGDADGNPQDDLQLPNGTVLQTPVSSEVLYGSYGPNWLIPAGQSLLPGARQRYLPPGRIVTVDSLPDNLRRAAEQAVDEAGITNPEIRNAAILDFALTGNREFIEAARLTDNNFDPIVETVAVDPVSSPGVVLTGSRLTLNEENAPARTARFTVTRSSAQGPLTVRYNVVGVGENPAQASDFLNGLPSGSVTIPNGANSASFDIVIRDDLLIEGEETFNVNAALVGPQANSFELLVSSVSASIVEVPLSNTINGTPGNDSILGNEFSSTINGLAGNDRIRAEAGDDVVNGGPGNDTILGGLGNDRLIGANGRDRILGQNGDDTVFGGAGRDILLGGNGDDNLAGQADNDRIKGFAGNDRLAGGTGNDRLIGNSGRDNLNGGAGNDVLNGGIGADRLRGGQGRDRFNVTQGGGLNTIVDFRDGSDRIVIGRRTDFEDLIIRQRGDDVLIRDDSRAIALLLNTNAAQLASEDFI